MKGCEVAGTFLTLELIMICQEDGQKVNYNALEQYIIHWFHF